MQTQPLIVTHSAINVHDMHVVDTPATFPGSSVLSLHQDSAPIGELGFFCSSGGVLMTFAIHAVVFASIRFLSVCMPVPNASALFLSLCGFLGCGFWLLAGKFDFLQMF